MGPGTMFKFVASDGIGNSQKRYQARRACENCRRRKKACHHIEPRQASKPKTSLSTSKGVSTPALSSHASYGLGNEQLEDQIQADGVAQVSDTATAPAGSLHEAVPTRDRATSSGGVDSAEASHQLLHRSDDPNSRFIGDLSPEGIFLSATSPDATRGGSVGVWLRTNSTQTPHHTLRSSQSLFYGSGSLIQQVFVPMLEQQCLSTIPASNTFDALAKIYFDKVYPIFPIIDEADFGDYSSTDPHRILLQQCICLAASKNFAAREHLLLDQSALPLSCREFGQRLSGAMRLFIEMGLVTNKVVIIQALGLMTQFTDNPVDEDLSSQLCTRAVNHVYSLGLHIKEDHDRSRKRLFCCVWAIDKLNAALYGRPVSIHERDLGGQFTSYFEAQEPSFRLFLKVIELLDKVIDMYRPASSDNPVLTWDFPAFEELVVDCRMPSTPVSTLASIETLYHAVAILSCRSKTWADPQRSSASYMRQGLSTVVLSSTVLHELQDHQLTLFPFVPYAMSLAMSVAYRELRHSKLTLHRDRARGQFQTLCDALTQLESIFWSASATSEMGRKLLREMDRVVSTVSSSERKSEQQYAAQNAETIDTLSSAAAVKSTAAIEGQAFMNGSNNTTTAQTMRNMDLSIFGSIPDIDLFGMFDPAFDLDGFDACLEGNLNPAFPNNFQ